MRYYLIITIRILYDGEWYRSIVPCFGPIDHFTTNLTFGFSFELVPEPYIYRDTVRES